MAAGGLLASVGTTGNAYDNAMAESLVDTYKTELIADRVWRTATEVELGTVGWVGWYNNTRLHGELGDVPPVEYERDALTAAAGEGLGARAATCSLSKPRSTVSTRTGEVQLPLRVAMWTPSR